MNCKIYEGPIGNDGRHRKVLILMGDQRASKSVMILDLIAGQPEGMSFTEIQRALWKMTHPGQPFTRAQRGYWGTNLLGGPFYHAGLLRFFAEKDANTGRWKRNEIAHNGHPWHVLRRAGELKRELMKFKL